MLDYKELISVIAYKVVNKSKKWKKAKGYPEVCPVGENVTFLQIIACSLKQMFITDQSEGRIITVLFFWKRALCMSRVIGEILEQADIRIVAIRISAHGEGYYKAFLSYEFSCLIIGCN